MSLPTPYYQSDRVTLYHGDCLEILPLLEGIDAVVSDPPYGIKAARKDNASRRKLAVAKDYGILDWDDCRPSPAAFNEIRRVSREQVLFGGNYFADLLPPTSSWIIWDKDNGANDFADFEIAWTSHKKAARKVRWRWNRMLQEPGHPKDKRVHPTQKPVGLMRWVLENYTPTDSLILDPYMGSGTTGVACLQTGRRFIGVEKERGYCEEAAERIAKAEKEQKELLPGVA